MVCIGYRTAIITRYRNKLKTGRWKVSNTNSVQVDDILGTTVDVDDDEVVVDEEEDVESVVVLDENESDFKESVVSAVKVRSLLLLLFDVVVDRDSDLGIVVAPSFFRS